MNETTVAVAAVAATTQQKVTFSVLQYLPHSNFTDALINLNTHISTALQAIMPHKWFLMPLIYDPLATLIVTVVIALVFTAFLDFLRHAWKIPFAIFVDILDVVAITNPFFNIFAAIGTFIIFTLLARKCSRFWKLGFVAGGLFKAFTPGLAMLPLNTIMMFIATVVDRD